MIKILIIDDEPLARSIVKDYLESYTNVSVVKECNDGFEGVKAINEYKPDLIFLDIQMPKLDGFEMLELLETIPSVIFTTAYDEYALKAFETHAVDYLLKPFDKERFDKSMQKWLANRIQKTEISHQLLNDFTKQPEARNRVVVKYGTNIKILPTIEIFYIEAFDDYVKIFTKDDYFLKKKTMNFFEQTLDSKDFSRVHRSFIIQLQCITRIESYEKNGHVAVLKNGKKIPLSRNGFVALKGKLGV
jgi:two-component system, LytTR family, response regulator